MKALTLVSFNISQALLQRLEEIAQYMNVSIDSLVEFALEREIHRKEVQRVKDEISIEEIRLNILREGETADAAVIDAASLNLDTHNCELCGTSFFKPLQWVDGPVFCESCLRLARGGAFELIEEEPTQAGLDARFVGEGPGGDDRN